MRSYRTRQYLRRVVSKGHPPCGICGLEIDYSLVYPDPYSFVVDHMKATARGGTNALNNVQPAHARCNRIKSDKDFAPEVVRRSGSLRPPAQGGAGGG